MDIKKLQKKVDQAIALLSDHDDKKDEQRYHNLRDKIEETQDYIDKNNYSDDISLELYNDLIKCMKEFEEDKFIFIIFLIILCGLLFIGVFYITYSHMHGHFPHRPGGELKPPHITKPQKTSTSTTKTTQVISTDKTDSTTMITTEITTSPSEDDDDITNAFVYLTFDNSNLIDLTNLYPILDSEGLKTKPTTWSLMSKLENSSKDYILTYFIDFKDDFGKSNDDNFIPVNKRLDVNKLKYQLLIKRSGSIVHDTGVQNMKDYPEATEGVRPIISAQTMNNDESLDFELRMWLDSATGNDQQGKYYRFKIDVYYEFEFIN